jgi:hypothetical protein
MILLEAVKGPHARSGSEIAFPSHPATVKVRRIGAEGRW